MSVDGQRRIYRAMLALLPKGFRREFGSEMEQVFADQLHRSDSAGRVWMSTIGDLARSASFERMEENMRRGYLTGLIGGIIAMVGLVGVLTGRREGMGLSTAMLGAGLMLVAFVGVAVIFARSADQPGSLVTVGGAPTSGSALRHLKWLAIPIAVPGFAVGFFGVAWGVVGLGAVGLGLLALSAVVWKVFGGRL